MIHHCRFSIIIAVAPPPPLHTPANPYLPPLLFMTVIRLWRILEPLMPMGWPRATAPPWTFTLVSGISRSFMLAMQTEEKA